MKPYVLTAEFPLPVPPEDLALLKKIRYGFDALPDLDLGLGQDGTPRLVSCHMLARAVARVFSLPFQDGLFLGRVNHSWVLTPKSGNIIDVYPVAIVGGPILVVAPQILKGMYLEQPLSRLNGTGIGTSRFRKAVNRLTAELATIDFPS